MRKCPLHPDGVSILWARFLPDYRLRQPARLGSPQCIFCRPMEKPMGLENENLAPLVVMMQGILNAMSGEQSGGAANRLPRELWQTLRG